MAFLDTTGLQRVWGKITSLFVPKNAALTEEEITTATTQGGSVAPGQENTVQSYIDSRVEALLTSGSISPIVTDEICVTSSNSLTLGGSSYNYETDEDEYFEIKCPKRPYFNINGNTYHLPWSSDSGINVDLAKSGDFVEKFRIIGQHFGGGYNQSISFNNSNEHLCPQPYSDYYQDLINLIDNDPECYISDSLYDLLDHGYFIPVKKNIKIENYSPELLNSDKFRVFFMKYGKAGRSNYSEHGTSSSSRRWRVKYFSGNTRRVNFEWWPVQGPITWFFGSEAHSKIDYWSLAQKRSPDIHCIDDSKVYVCAIFENIRGTWVRVSNIATFRSRKYFRQVVDLNDGSTQVMFCDIGHQAV